MGLLTTLPFIFLCYILARNGLVTCETVCMTIEVVPELGVEVPDDIGYLDLKKRLEAACATVKDLEVYGLDTSTLTDFDHEIAATLTNAYAEDPEKISRELTEQRMSALLTPSSVVLVSNLLDEFGRLVVTDSVKIRNLITNKLLIESDNPDAKVRLRALELLGKISDVGLFTEKREVTVTHQTSDELRETLRSKLAKLVGDEVIEDAVIIESE